MLYVRPGDPSMRGSLREIGSVRWSYPVHPTAGRLARAVARATVGAVGGADVGDRVALAVSELLGNAVEASRATTDSRLDVRLTWTRRRVRVEVHDAVAKPPCPRAADPMDESGRGLWIVSELAVRWGSEPTPSGKCVWAEIALPDPTGG